MDQKERYILSRLRDRLAASSFSELDALAFLIGVRRHAQGGCRELVELGDFVAHRERDKGLLLAFMRRVQAALAAPPGGPQAEFHLPLDAQKLEGQLRTVMAALALAELPSLAVRCLCVVTAGLLHGIRFDAGDGSPFWQLCFGFNHRWVGLFGSAPLPAAIVRFPVFLVENHFFDPVYPDPEAFWNPSNLVTVSCESGQLKFREHGAA